MKNRFTPSALILEDRRLCAGDAVTMGYPDPLLNSADVSNIGDISSAEITSTFATGAADPQNIYFDPLFIPTMEIPFGTIDPGLQYFPGLLDGTIATVVSDTSMTEGGITLIPSNNPSDNLGEYLRGYTYGPDGLQGIKPSQIDPVTRIPFNYTPTPGSGFVLNYTNGTIATDSDGVVMYPPPQQ